MKLKVGIVIGVIVVVLISVVALSNQAQQTSGKGDHVVASPAKDASASAAYMEYSKTALDQFSDKRRVLFFYANWCPTCIPADESFKKNSSLIPKDVVIIRVNYDDSDTDQEEKELANKHGITYQHTFVQIDNDGNEVAKWNGGQVDELLGNIK